MKSNRPRREREDLGTERFRYWAFFYLKWVGRHFVSSMKDMRQFIIIDEYLTCCPWEELKLNSN